MNGFRKILRPIHRWIWQDPERCGRRLIRFAATEEEGGRDLARAAEMTPDPLLRRLYLVHSQDERTHAELFRRRGSTLLGQKRGQKRGQGSDGFAEWLTPGERGFDDLRIEAGGDRALLAFLHLSERAAALDFAAYRHVLRTDPETQALFDEILQDEAYHMNYTLAQLNRVAPRRRGAALWGARLDRLWQGYLRLATALAGLISGVMLTCLYFTLLPPFAWLARRAQRRETSGWTLAAQNRSADLRRQY